MMMMDNFSQIQKLLIDNLAKVRSFLLSARGAKAQYERYSTAALAFQTIRSKERKSPLGPKTGC